MDKSFNMLLKPAWLVAPRLLGCELIRTINGQNTIVRIVETEAYDQTDAASHSYRGLTPRTAVMFGQPGRAYIYFTYGLHYCFNVVTGPSGTGSAVLIRAVEPLTGIKIIRKNRPNINSKFQLLNGPAKLCQALNINREFNSHNLLNPPFQLVIKKPLKTEQIKTTTRIGITRDIDRLWRFYIKDNLYISHA